MFFFKRNFWLTIFAFLLILIFLHLSLTVAEIGLLSLTGEEKELQALRLRLEPEYTITLIFAGKSYRLELKECLVFGSELLQWVPGFTGL
ncbi:MAG: hypothetical protein ACOYBM_03640 [Dethiobacteria bacterium]|jgi:hypothetical protein|nr:hypothetical protein [Bacillota bacterium]